MLQSFFFSVVSFFHFFVTFFDGGVASHDRVTFLRLGGVQSRPEAPGALPIYQTLRWLDSACLLSEKLLVMRHRGQGKALSVKA